eukprot:1151014-Pelagomonas_calceolata.AAC.2
MHETTSPTGCKPVHMHLIEIQYCEDTRPGQQLEAAQLQHAGLSKLIYVHVVTLHTIFLRIDGMCFSEHTLNQFDRLELDTQYAIKLARKLHVQFQMPYNS